MKKEDLIKQCRYYKGQEESPFNNADMDYYWDLERVWVEHDGQIEGERAIYEYYNGKKFPGIPYTLVITMWTSYAKWSYLDEESLKGFYSMIEEYLDIPSDHIPKDRIPG